MTNRELADIFQRIGDMLDILGENRFKVLAYRRAAENILNLGQDIRAYWQAGTLQEIPGHRPGHRRKDRRAADHRPPGILRAAGGPGASRRRLSARHPRRRPQDGQAAVGGTGSTKRGRGRSGGAGGPDPHAARAWAPSRRPRSWPASSCSTGAATASRWAPPGRWPSICWRGCKAHCDEVIDATVAGSLRRMRATIGDIDLLAASDVAGGGDARLCGHAPRGRGAAQRRDQDQRAAAQRPAGGPARAGAGALGRGAAIFHRQPGPQRPRARNRPEAGPQPERVRLQAGGRQRDPVPHRGGGLRDAGLALGPARAARGPGRDPGGAGRRAAPTWSSGTTCRATCTPTPTGATAPAPWKRWPRRRGPRAIATCSSPTTPRAWAWPTA